MSYNILVPANYTRKKAFIMKKLFAVLLILIGIFSISVSFSIKDMNIGYTESDKSYGGDAYTGIQNAAAQAANNTLRLTEVVKTSFSNIFLISGAVLIVFGAKDIVVVLPAAAPAKKEEDTPAQDE